MSHKVAAFHILCLRSTTGRCFQQQRETLKKTITDRSREQQGNRNVRIEEVKGETVQLKLKLQTKNVVVISSVFRKTLVCKEEQETKKEERGHLEQKQR